MSKGLRGQHFRWAQSFMGRFFQDNHDKNKSNKPFESFICESVYSENPHQTQKMVFWIPRSEY